MKTKGFKFGSNRGQSVVEFALVFPLFMLFFVGIVEFGLFFWTAHVVQNGGREGARQAVVLSNLVANDSRVIDRVDLVLPVSGLISGLTITNNVPDCDADGQVTVTVTGTYNFIFLNIIGINQININIPTTMRYEGC